MPSALEEPYSGTPDAGETFLVRLGESRVIDLLDQTREVLENRRCLRLPSWFEVHERRIIQRFADVPWNHPFGKCCERIIHGSGDFRRCQDAICRLGIEESWYRFEEQRWKKSRVNARRPSICHNDREGSCVMGFVPIRMDEFIKLHRKSNPGERPDEFIRLLRQSVADARQGARCHCGAHIWAIGSAVVGNACFTCITGEADPSSDYEIDEVLKGRGR